MAVLLVVLELEVLELLDQLVGVLDVLVLEVIRLELLENLLVVLDLLLGLSQLFLPLPLDLLRGLLLLGRLDVLGRGPGVLGLSGPMGSLHTLATYLDAPSDHARLTQLKSLTPCLLLLKTRVL